MTAIASQAQREKYDKKADDIDDPPMATMTEYGLGIEFKAPKHLTTVV